jgi:hypothetical protein
MGFVTGYFSGVVFSLSDEQAVNSMAIMPICTKAFFIIMGPMIYLNNEQIEEELY